MPRERSLSETPTEFTVRARVEARRIDHYLHSRFPDYSRSVFQKVIDAGAVLVNDQPVKASYRVQLGDVVRVWLPELDHDEIEAEDLPLTIAFEDEHMLVIDKAPGMVVHPAKGHWTGTLVNALQFRFESLSTVGGEHRPGIVHRLDRDTSGLILVAKDDRAHARLAKQFEARTIRKEYLTITYNAPERDSDYIERLIGPHPTHREKMAIRRAEDGGKASSTFYQVLERFRGYGLVRCKPMTGRTHQIRVHLAHVGCPIVADKLYSGRNALAIGELDERSDEPDRVLIARQALHAHRLELEHPGSGAPITLESPLPADMAATLEALRARRSID